MTRMKNVEKVIIPLFAVIAIIYSAIGIYIAVKVYATMHFSMCKVTQCDSILTYSLTTGTSTTYDATFYIPGSWQIICEDTIRCAYSDDDPKGTFGGWINLNEYNTTKSVCINGMCYLYSGYTLNIIWSVVTANLILVPILVYHTIKCCRRKGYGTLYVDYET